MQEAREQYYAMIKEAGTSPPPNIKNALEFLANEYHETVRLFLDDEANQPDIARTPGIIKFLSLSSFKENSMDHSKRESEESSQFGAASSWADRLNSHNQEAQADERNLTDAHVRKYLRNLNSVINKLKLHEGKNKQEYSEALQRFYALEREFERISKVQIKNKGDGEIVRAATQLNSNLLSDFYESLIIRNPRINDFSSKVLTYVMMFLINDSQLQQSKFLEKVLYESLARFSQLKSNEPPGGRSNRDDSNDFGRTNNMTANQRATATGQEHNMIESEVVPQHRNFAPDLDRSTQAAKKAHELEQIKESSEKTIAQKLEESSDPSEKQHVEFDLIAEIDKIRKNLIVSDVKHAAQESHNHLVAKLMPLYNPFS